MRHISIPSFLCLFYNPVALFSLDLLQMTPATFPHETVRVPSTEDPGLSQQIPRDAEDVKLRLIRNARGVSLLPSIYLLRLNNILQLKRVIAPRKKLTSKWYSPKSLYLVGTDSIVVIFSSSKL